MDFFGMARRRGRDALRDLEHQKKVSEIRRVDQNLESLTLILEELQKLVEDSGILKGHKFTFGLYGSREMSAKILFDAIRTMVFIIYWKK